MGAYPGHYGTSGQMSKDLQGLKKVPIIFKMWIDVHKKDAEKEVGGGGERLMWCHQTNLAAAMNLCHSLHFQHWI